MYVGFFPHEMSSYLRYEICLHSSKLRNMPNLLDWRYLYLAFANCIHLNEILCGRHFFFLSARFGFWLHGTLHIVFNRTCNEFTNFVCWHKYFNGHFFWLPAFCVTCNTQFECREFILNNSLVFLPLFFFLWMCVT